MLKAVFVLKNWKYIVSSLAAIAVGFGSAWFIQGVRVEYAKSKISNLKSQIAVCLDVNKTNQETIGKLKDEAARANSLCSSRLSIKDGVMKRIRDIDNLKASPLRGSAEAAGHLKSARCNKEEGNDEKKIDAAADDPVLFELNCMFSTGTECKD